MNEQSIRAAVVGTSRRARTWGAALLLGVALAACTQQATVPAAQGVQLEATSTNVGRPLSPQLMTDPRPGGWLISDPNASGGQAVMLYGARDSVNFKLPRQVTPGTYTVSVVARGEQFEGAPIVELTNGNGQSLGTLTLDNTAYAERAFTTTALKAGDALVVRLLNDAYAGPDQDRNAVIDYLVVTPAQGD
ncbi:carbohydrate-binding domain-containing protein [Deinococcus maricopensis]|uniref:Carbohydrate binding module xylan-binding domain-containing protein n=1 Tax=Deinococcus maricopensis (strain DSM 21211 / LMG 22137 / NRRL B-23946 / LB-34) TaxID=709986 RepID=E8U9H2_DEIML|nr:carbohydrate-binding domain-containing protein [Deinococcus maricopensis]ADV67711.1 hypothetical protein Deima_2068 [Deinococcus maricopensis DSM 21211]